MPEKALDRDDLKAEYEKKAKKLEKLGEKLKAEFEECLNDEDVEFHSITHRVKEFESFSEKIRFKGYSIPFEDCEDLCGIRIIHYYNSDAGKIEDIINAETDVLDRIDKTGALEADRFGYHSIHYIVKLKEKFKKIQSFRGLSDHKVEIQVRTITQHAWAEIEHKLAYKKSEDVPSEFRRKFAQISALFEIADEKFDDVRRERAKYTKEITKTLEKDESVEDIPVNLDSLEVLIDHYFPELQNSRMNMPWLMNVIKVSGVNYREIESCIKKLKPNLDSAYTLFVKRYPYVLWNKLNATTVALDVYSEQVWKSRKNEMRKNNWGEYITELKQKLNPK